VLTLQSIIDNIESNNLNAKINLMITNNNTAYAIERCKNSNIPTHIIKSEKQEDIDLELEEVLKKYNIDLIVLAGYLKKIGSNIIKKYKIINTHPSLLPKYGGKGMYGMNVHRAVVEAKEKVSGVTVHFVDEHYDTGNIIMQTEVDVLETDTPEDLSAKVQKAEKIQLINVLKKFEEEL